MTSAKRRTRDSKFRREMLDIARYLDSVGLDSTADAVDIVRAIGGYVDGLLGRCPDTDGDRYRRSALVLRLADLYKNPR